MREIISLALVVLGGLLMMDIKLMIPRFNIRTRTQEMSKKIEQLSHRKRKEDERASEYVARIDGRTRENFVGRSYREARNVYDAIGQADRYQRTLELSLLAGLAGAAGGLALRNIPLAAVLAVGCYFLPLWLSRFSLYRYQRFANEELETALSLITTSYLRSSDILAAVEENLSAIKEPVRSVFVSFCNGLKYIDANAPAQIERMKEQLDNKLFWEWCDILILCQDNHLLQAALPPVVNKFSVLKAQQEANETRMMEPLKYAATMAALVVGFPFLLKLLNQVWYENLMHTIVGQFILAGACIAVFITVNKAIHLSEPISYDV